ncbi:MAG: AroM family protein [Candidatus Dormibacteraceae bacterium]
MELVERGALDGLTTEEVTALGPRPGGEVLVSQRADGTPVRLDRDAILERLQNQIEALEAAGISATLLLCTGSFPPFTHRRPLLCPSEALRGAVLGIAGPERLASMVPLEEQFEQGERWWLDQGACDLTQVAADPYAAGAEDAVEEAARRAAGDGASVLFLDCFGYSGAMRERARQGFGGTVVAARSLAARLLAEMAGA